MYYQSLYFLINKKFSLKRFKEADILNDETENNKKIYNHIASDTKFIKNDDEILDKIFHSEMGDNQL